MKQTAIALNWLIRLVGLVMIVLGLLIWSGRGDDLTSTHKFFGFVLVLSLWALAAIGLRVRVAPGFLLLVVGWSILMPALGLTQTDILTGDAHWIIRVIHLLVGLAALALADSLANAIKNRSNSDRPPVPVSVSER